MSKSILISIKPKWVAKILNGEKTVEIRKTMPKCDLPIDVYIYCTKEETLVKNGTIYFINDLYKKEKNVNRSGKVVAKFTLNKVEDCPCIGHLNPNKAEQSCVDWVELGKYTKYRRFYLWHIDNLVIFDEPKELGMFRHNKDCMKCPYKVNTVHCLNCGTLTKAPQSYMFIEVDEGKVLK